jgi:hypothetical protein
MRVLKWGKSLAVRIPNAVIDELGLKKAIRSRFGSWASAPIGSAATETCNALLPVCANCGAHCPLDLSLTGKRRIPDKAFFRYQCTGNHPLKPKEGLSGPPATLGSTHCDIDDKSQRLPCVTLAFP